MNKDKQRGLMERISTARNNLRNGHYLTQDSQRDILSIELDIMEAIVQDDQEMIDIIPDRKIPEVVEVPTKYLVHFEVALKDMPVLRHFKDDDNQKLQQEVIKLFMIAAKRRHDQRWPMSQIWERLEDMLRSEGLVELVHIPNYIINNISAWLSSHRTLDLIKKAIHPGS